VWCVFTVAKKLDRKSLRELNAKKVLHAKLKEHYSFVKNKKKIKLELDISKLSDADKQSIEAEVEVILERYFNKKVV
jgi:hypothetical protein